VDHPAQHITPQIIRAQQEFWAGRDAHVLKVGLGRVIRGNKRRQECQQDKRDHDSQAHEGHAVAQKAAHSASIGRVALVNLVGQVTLAK